MSARRTALLGFGNVAARGHVPAWRARRDFAVVAVADPDPARRALAAETLPGVRVYGSADALFTGETVDVVDIAAPPAWHAALTARSARAGCHILCEKPLALSLAEHEAACDAVRAAGVTLCAVHNWKHSEQFVRAAALLGDGAIGRLSHVRLETIRNGRAVAVGRDWRAGAAAAGGGILFDHGWHALYLLRRLTGERPLGVSATLERRDPGAAAEDTATCRIEFESLRGEIFLTWAGDERRTRWKLRGTEGTLTVEDGWMAVRRRGESQRFVFGRSLSDGSHHADWFGAVIDDFAAEIADPTARGESLREAEECLTLIGLAYASAAQGGCWLPVPSGSATVQHDVTLAPSAADKEEREHEDPFSPRSLPISSQPRVPPFEKGGPGGI